MKVLVRKEVRSILPAWLLAMVLATLPIWLVWPGPQGVMLGDLGLLVFAPFGFGVLLLSLTPFGQELNWGTFSVLLSQPIPRQQLWRVKLAVLSAALVFTFIAFCISNHIRVDSTLEFMKNTVWRNAFDHEGDQSRYFAKIVSETRLSATLDTFFIGGLEVLAGLVGGLWTTLLFRQVTAAFWLTFLVPMGLAVLASNVFRNLSDTAGRIALALVLGAYCVASFVWAKRYFLRAQDVQWTGGVVVLPSWGELGVKQRAVASRRRSRPVRAIFCKELQAQQVNLLLGCCLLLVHLSVIAMRRWSTEYLATHRSVAMILEMIPLLWLAMPLLVGSVAVAEERKLGMLQSTQCLPAGRRCQFLIKLMVVMALGIFFGGVLPLLIESLALHNNVGGGPSFLIIEEGHISSDVFLQFSGALGLSAMGFYASTLTRNALQAMAAALLGTLLAWLIILGAVHAGDFPELILWQQGLIALIGWPVMTLTLFVLAFRNFKVLLPDSRLWFKNVVAVAAALLCVAAVTTTVYHRVWEAWLPEEPPHRFTPRVDNFRSMRTVRTPRPAGDVGGYLGASIQDLTPGLSRQFNFSQSTGALVSNVAPNSPADRAGLKAGDLLTQFNGTKVADSSQLVRVVASTKPDSKVQVEIIRDGSTHTMTVPLGHFPETRRLPEQRPAAPKLMAVGPQKAALLADGRLWLQQRPLPLVVNNKHLTQWEVAWWYATGRQYTGFVDDSEWSDVGITIAGCFGIRDDGTLWDISPTELGTPKLSQVGRDHDWEALSAGGRHFSALKSDGTIWEWGWKNWPLGANLTTPRQVNDDSDWVAVSDGWMMSAAIKTDGSIWRWGWNPREKSLPRRWLTGGCSEPVSFAFAAEAVASVCADGTLWIGGDLTNTAYARLIGPGLAGRATVEMVRWGNDSDWSQISFVSWGGAVGIKRDGSLWEWDVRYILPQTGWIVPPLLRSHYSDWTSICHDDNAFLTLARDGSLCLWGDPQDMRDYNWYGPYPNPHSLLMPSRIKARRIANLSR